MPPEYRELCAPTYAGRLLGCSPQAAVRRLGPPCAELFQVAQIARLYRVNRVLAHRQGLSFQPPDEPFRFFSLYEARRTIEQLCAIETTKPRVREILGAPTAVLVSLNEEHSLWSQADINAAVQLVGDQPEGVKRVAPFKPRVSAKQCTRIERRRNRTVGAWKRPPWTCKRCGSSAKIHLCKPVHLDVIKMPTR